MIDIFQMRWQYHRLMTMSQLFRGSTLQPVGLRTATRWTSSHGTIHSDLSMGDVEVTGGVTLSCNVNSLAVPGGGTADKGSYAYVEDFEFSTAFCSKFRP